MCRMGSRRCKEAEERVWLGHKVLSVAISFREEPFRWGRGGTYTQGVSNDSAGMHSFLLTWKESHDTVFKNIGI